FHSTVRVGIDRAAGESAEPAADLRGARVLVVDDNETNRRILAGMLVARGVEALAVADGEAALEALRRGGREGRPYALALIDFQMPRLDGIGLAAKIRATPELRGLKMILLTSS